jgi:hypothetical protein
MWMRRKGVELGKPRAWVEAPGHREARRELID